MGRRPRVGVINLGVELRPPFVAFDSHVTKKAPNMPNENAPPEQLGESQCAAFALAGTVALPSPFPAVGMVSIGLFPPPDGGGGANFEPTYYVRIVHRLNDSHIITRYIRP